jgi:hypothetical protein
MMHCPLSLMSHLMPSCSTPHVQQPAPSAVIRNCPGFAARTTSARLSGSKENSCATLQPCSSPEATLVYAVCSLLAEEGAKQVQAFLNEHRQFARVDD